MFSLPMTGWKAIEDRKEKVAMIELAYHTLQATPFISHFLKSPPSNFCGPGSLATRSDTCTVLLARFRHFNSSFDKVPF